MATPQQLLQQARGRARPVLSKPVTRVPPGGGMPPRGVKVAPAGQSRPAPKPAPQQGGPPAGAGPNAQGWIPPAAPPGGQAPNMGRYNPAPVDPGDMGPGSVGPGAGRLELGARSPGTGVPPFDPSVLPGRGTGVPIQPPGGAPGSLAGGAAGGPTLTPVPMPPPPGPLPSRYAGMPPEVAAQRFAAFQAGQLPGQQNHVVTDIAPRPMLGFKPMAAGIGDAGPGAAPNLRFPPQGGGPPAGIGIGALPPGGPPGTIGGGSDGGVGPVPGPVQPIPGPGPAPSPFQSFGQIGANMMRRRPPTGGAPQGL